MIHMTANVESKQELGLCVSEAHPDVLSIYLSSGFTTDGIAFNGLEVGVFGVTPAMFCQLAKDLTQEWDRVEKQAAEKKEAA